MTTKNASYNPNAILFDICQQRKRQQWNNIPPIRLELMTSPYGKYSQRQLDMRRKTEILKYKPILQNSQTNNQTKKEKMASILKGTYKQMYDKLDAQKCPLDDFIPTPTSSCDVPGPPMLLTYDPTVPLYNYISDLQTRAYAFLPQDLTIPWSISFSIVDYILSNDTNNSDYMTFSSIYFRYLLNQPQIYFDLTLPVQLSVNAVGITNNNDIQSNTYAITIHILQIRLAIYYNETQVSNRVIIPTLNSTLSSQMTIQDISGGKNFFVNHLNIGYLQVPHIAFQSETGFIYDLKMSWNVNTTVTNPKNSNDNNSILTLFDTFQVKLTVNSDNSLASNISYTLTPIPPPNIPPFSLISNEYYIGNPPTLPDR